MRRLFLAIPLALIALLAVAWLAWSLGSDDETIGRLDRSVVRLFIVGPVGTVSGTGFAINNDGYIATNFHVIEAHVKRQWRIFVVDHGAQKEDRRPAQLVEAFPGEDIAILRVVGLRRPPVTFADLANNGPSKGVKIFAIGFPGAGDRLGPVDDASFVSGAVSRIFSGPWAEDAPQIQIIQHTTPTNPGNSGGPLADECGNVIGLNSQREAHMVFGPGGITLVTDPIQGVFYASHASVLMEKLRGLGLAFQTADERCASGALGIPGLGRIEIMAIAALVLSLIALVIVLRPRPLVQVVVNCGELIGDCAHAVEQALRRLKLSKNGADEIEITAAPPPHEREPDADAPPNSKDQDDGEK